MAYLTWNETTITDMSTDAVADAYARGYVFTRIGRGVMQQTRSVRIRLANFTLSSENRRILKKTDSLTYTRHPLPYERYTWNIGKMAKDFYEARDADFSANKIKELLTDAGRSNFTHLLEFKNTERECGYAIIYHSTKILHYSYPFYTHDAPKDTGMGMMLRAITSAQAEGLDYIYLGSLQRSSDVYKLQFAGIEWFDGTTWSSDIEAAKYILATL